MVYTPGDFDRNHLLLVWGGVLPGNETWSCSVKLSDGRVGSPAVGVDAYLSTVDTNDWVNGFIADAVLAYHQRVTTYCHPSVILQYCKLNLINRQGHYDAGTTSEHVFSNTPGGGLDNPRYPNQVAMVVSLTTNVSRGPAHRGRYYLPMPTLAVSTDGRVAQADANAAAASAKTFLEAISDVPGLDLASSPGAVVMSRKLGAAKTREVTGVEVGRVLDTQRRRRRSLAEGYESSAVSQGLA